MAHHRMGRHRAEMAQAAIRSDRGGGTMTVNGSEAVCIEGLNSLKLTNCDLTGNMQDLSQNDCTWNVILYQSTLSLRWHCWQDAAHKIQKQQKKQINR